MRPIVCLQKLKHDHLLRTRQFIPNSAESLNWVQKVEIKLIDRGVANAQQNKMADRLGESNDFLIQSKSTKTKH